MLLPGQKSALGQNYDDQQLPKRPKKRPSAPAMSRKTISYLHKFFIAKTV
jgi:hypothetical protein